MNTLRYSLSVNVTTICLLLAGCGERDLTDLKQYKSAVIASSAGQQFEALPVIPSAPRFEYTAYSLKDPFKSSKWIVEPMVEPIPGKPGPEPDPGRPREELEKYTLGALAMVGTVQGFPQQGRIAFIKAPDGIVHRVVPGNYMGDNHGKVIAISEQRIDLQEIVPKTGNQGWEERLSFLALAE